jgi:hypothetical protein
MSWSSTLTPTPVAGKAIRFSWFTQLLENLNLLNGGQSNEQPQAFSPTWSSVGGTGITVGNATITGQYKKIMGYVFFEISMTFGNTSAQGASNTWLFSLPVTALNTTFGVFVATLFDAGTQTYSATGVLNNTTTLSLIRSDASGDGALGGSNTPIATWVGGDALKISGFYRWS